jgi:hypothetical protein
LFVGLNKRRLILNIFDWQCDYDVNLLSIAAIIIALDPSSIFTCLPLAIMTSHFETAPSYCPHTGKACLFDSRRLLARCLAHWASLHQFHRRVNAAWRPVGVTVAWRRAADAWCAWRECAYGVAREVWLGNEFECCANVFARGERERGSLMSDVGRGMRFECRFLLHECVCSANECALRQGVC